MNKKELKQYRIYRAKSELTLSVLQLMYNFKSKEEPTITLSEKEKVEVLLNLASEKVSKYLKDNLEG